MNIIIKHAGRKAEITQQSNGIPVCKLYGSRNTFLRSRTFPDVDQAFDFASTWLWEMEEQKSNDFVKILHDWERSSLSATIVK